MGLTWILIVFYWGEAVIISPYLFSESGCKAAATAIQQEIKATQAICIRQR